MVASSYRLPDFLLGPRLSRVGGAAKRSPFGKKTRSRVKECSSCGAHGVPILYRTVQVNCWCAIVGALVGRPLGHLVLLRF